MSDTPEWLDRSVQSRLIRDVGAEILGRTIDLFLQQAPARLEALRDGVLQSQVDHPVIGVPAAQAGGALAVAAVGARAHLPDRHRMVGEAAD